MSVAMNAAEWALEKVGCRYSQMQRAEADVFDCSSLVARAYSAQGKEWMYGGKIPRSNQEVYDDEFELLWPEKYSEIGRSFGSMDVIVLGNKAGDLQFVCTDRDTSRANRITHVAMVTSDTGIVHARGTAYGVCTGNINLYSGKICAITRYNPECILRTGMRGYRTLALQNALNGMGSNIAADGVFGEQTEGAVADFQKSMGTKPTGDVDTEMMKALKLLPVNGKTEVAKSVLVTGRTVNVRRGPGTEFASEFIAKAGDRFEAADTEGWIPVLTEDRLLWISEKYVQLEKSGKENE